MVAGQEFEDRYFSGAELWGDAFGPAELEQWLADEREGYASLDGAGVEYAHVRGEEHGYGFRGFNEWLGYRHLPAGPLGRALGLGSAFGDEFLPVADRLSSLTIVEPSQTLRGAMVGPIAPEYVDPTPSGDLPFESEAFDLVVCLGVLHHIANVSHVMGEVGRVTAPGGWMLLREPMISMGDWREQRQGLTPRERGIPRDILDRIVVEAGFTVVRASWCDFPTTRRIATRLPIFGYGSQVGAVVDQLLSGATSFNYRYHARSPWQKVRPISRFYVLRRR